MKRGVLSIAFLMAVAACNEPGHIGEAEANALDAEDVDDVEARSALASGAAPEPAEVDPFTTDRHMASASVASDGFDQAEGAVSPPAVGTALPRLSLARPQPTIAQLETRLLGVLEIMDVALEPGAAAQWAQEAHAGSGPAREASVLEPAPGIVVSYDARFDDLAVVHLGRFGAEEHSTDDTVPWSIARDVMDELVDRGLVDRSLSFDEPRISFVRSGVKGPEGDHDKWINEIRFESNAMVGDVPVLDIGLRLGVTPASTISSLRLSRVDVVEVQTVTAITVGASEVDLRESFALHVAESMVGTPESVHVAERRPAYVMGPDVSSMVVEPTYLIRYAVFTGGPEALVGSRETMIFMNLTAPSSLIDLQLP